MLFEQVKFDVRGGFPFSLFEHHRVIKAEVRLPHLSVFIGTSCELMAACAGCLVGCLLGVMAGWTRRRLPLTQLLSSLARHTHTSGDRAYALNCCAQVPSQGLSMHISLCGLGLLTSCMLTSLCARNHAAPANTCRKHKAPCRMQLRWQCTQTWWTR